MAPVRLQPATQPRVTHAPASTQPRARPQRVDGFVGPAQARAQAQVLAPHAEATTAAFQENLGRAPTAEELRRFGSFADTLVAQGKSPDEVNAAFKYVICAGPEWQAKSVSQAELGREPTAEELQKAIAWGNDLQAQGKSTGEIRAAFEFVTRMGPEWQARSVSQEELGRLPTADEQAKAKAWGESLVAQGKTTPEVRAAFQYVTRMGPEWQGRAAYQELLGRAPTADEQARTAAWGQELAAQGHSTEEIRGAFNFVIAQSPEYQEAHRPEAVRNQVAQWAIAQANDPNVGYSQTAGRFGDRVDSNGHRYFDCSGLVTAAYAQAGIHLPANWTGAMQSSWPQWADQVPKNTSAMQPGDLILMNGHVVMYTGDGKCVGAQTSHTAFADQVTTNIDANHYLSRSDAIVIRPRV